MQSSDNGICMMHGSCRVLQLCNKSLNMLLSAPADVPSQLEFFPRLVQWCNQAMRSEYMSYTVAEELFERCPLVHHSFQPTDYNHLAYQCLLYKITLPTALHGYLSNLSHVLWCISPWFPE